MGTHTNCTHPDVFERYFGTLPKESRNPADITWQWQCGVCEEISARTTGLRAGLTAQLAAAQLRGDTYRRRALALRSQAVAYRWLSLHYSGQPWKRTLPSLAARARATAAETHVATLELERNALRLIQTDLLVELDAKTLFLARAERERDELRGRLRAATDAKVSHSDGCEFWAFGGSCSCGAEGLRAVIHALAAGRAHRDGPRRER